MGLFHLHSNENLKNGLPVIGVDIDGVLADFNSAFINKVNTRFGTSWETHHVSEYKYQTCIGLSDDAVEGIFSEMLEDESYAELMRMPMANLLNFLPGRVQLVTNRIPALKEKTLDWLEQHNIYNYENILFIEGNKSRAESILELEFDYFIEDSLKNALDLSPVCGLVFLIDHPYNQCDSLPPNVHRVSGWKQIFSTFMQNEI